MNTNEENTIRQLLERFMAGTTTVEEERRIARWFQAHPEVSADLEAYRELFAWFGAGLPTDEQGQPIVRTTDGQAGETARAVGRSADSSATASRPAVARRRYWLYAAAIAIVVGFAALMVQQRPETAGPQIASLPAHPSDSISATETGGKKLAPADTLATPPMEPSCAGKRARGYQRHKFSPAPPQTLLAVTDSMVVEGDRMVGEVLARMDAEQDRLQREIDLDNLIDNHVLTAILQDGAIADGQAEDDVY